ncbi:MAG: hypothetical protein IT450_14840 [Phycisphaerales bacterium]|nr:hypothetical protein [Phycisphaerales bacterium]
MIARNHVKEVTRGFSTDATKTVYVYDEAGRTTEIRHETIVGPNTLHQTTYTWNLNNTLASRVETDNFGRGGTVRGIADNVCHCSVSSAFAHAAHERRRRSPRR